MFENLQEFIGNLPVALQWAGVILIAVIPFVESYFGSIIGVVVGVHPAIAIPAAIIGNTVSMLVCVFAASSARAVIKRGKEEVVLSPRKQRVRAAFDKYGVVAVSLFGQFIMASQITSTAMVSFGADRGRVIRWQIVAIILWGVVSGTLAFYGIQVLFRI